MATRQIHTVLLLAAASSVVFLVGCICGCCSLIDKGTTTKKAYILNGFGATNFVGKGMLIQTAAFYKMHQMEKIKHVRLQVEIINLCAEDILITCNGVVDTHAVDWFVNGESTDSAMVESTKIEENLHDDLYRRLSHENYWDNGRLGVRCDGSIKFNRDVYFYYTHDVIPSTLQITVHAQYYCIGDGRKTANYINKNIDVPITPE